MELESFIIRLADTLIELHPQYPYLREYCRDYIVTAGEPSLTIAVTLEDIAWEQVRSDREAEVEGLRPIQYSPDYLETLAVYRKIVTALLDQNVLLYHGSCIAVDGQAYLFTAKSGTGKSTHTRLWREMLGDRVITVNDDKPLLRLTDDGVIVYGTPWDGKHRLSTNTALPLRAICALERAEENHIEKCTMEELYPLLVQQVYRPRDTAAMFQTLELLDTLCDQVGLYRLGCNMDPEAAVISYNGMRG